jgi:DNA (cytosine-5)-methyltransferase 1
MVGRAGSGGGGVKQPLIIDNFAGGGGASTGLEQALGRPVDVAINHDEAAIAVHAANHPTTRHYCQSIYSVDPLDATGGAPVMLAWFSPDCKHHSKAKGGKPREKHIRDLAWVVPHWIERLQRAAKERGDPNWRSIISVIMLENVEEFRHWGPLDERGMPIKERRGEEFDLWVRRMRRLGGKVEYRELVACDYGAPTKRKRLYMIIRFDGLPIIWPKPTHGRPDSAEVRSGKLQPWRTAAECIDWSLPCPSIFDRARPLKEATCRRIAAGVMRYVVNSARPFIIPICNTGWTGARAWSADEPLRTITTAKGGEMAAVGPSLVSLTHHGGERVYPVDHPMRTITTANRGETALAAASMIKLRNNCIGSHPESPIDVISTGGHHCIAAATLIQTGYGEAPGQSPRALDIDAPLGTVVAGGAKHAAVAAFLAQHNSERGDRVNPGQPADKPLSTITGRGTQQQAVQTTLIAADALPADQMARAVQVAAFLVKYYGSEIGQHQAVDVPLDTVTAKPRFAVITVTLERDGDAITYVLVDIGMRMLEPKELAAAMGFPSGYIFNPECRYRTDGGNMKFGPLPKSQQIAKIGNAVCPVMSKELARANLPQGADAERIAA